jgi:hypothetical protein
LSQLMARPCGFAEIAKSTGEFRGLIAV